MSVPRSGAASLVEGAPRSGSAALVDRRVESAASAGPERLRAPRRDDGSLVEERRLLDHAQSALGQRDPAVALADVGMHARRFPNGQLQAEREAIAIRALVLAGRAGEAGARARRFRADFPNSLFAPAVESVVGK
jgi:hypothetical protein